MICVDKLQSVEPSQQVDNLIAIFIVNLGNENTNLSEIFVLIQTTTTTESLKEF